MFHFTPFRIVSTCGSDVAPKVVADLSAVAPEDELVAKETATSPPFKA